MSKPGDFLLGVSDFFAVVLPGAIATWVVAKYLPKGMQDVLDVTAGRDNAARWAAFLVSSYTLGHFVFMLGSRLDPAYDRWRKREKPLDEDRVYAAADDLRKEATPRIKESHFSTLKWAKAYIEIHCPHARVEIDRLETNQKFFRSLVVISVGLAVHFLVREQETFLAIASVGMTVLSFQRYCDQRWKMTELTYATAVILHVTKPRDTAQSGKVAGQSSDH